MKHIQKVAVIGGTGKSGKYLVRQLISQNIPFKILVRNVKRISEKNTPIESPLIEVLHGDVRDYQTVLSLMEGCQAVISTLGLGNPPSEKNVFSQATKNIIRALNEPAINNSGRDSQVMQTDNARRYIVITGLNVDSPFDKKGPKTKMATDWMYANYPLTTADKQKEYDLLSESTINWTLVRLPFIELTDLSTQQGVPGIQQTDSGSKIKVSLEDCPGDKISAADLAHFLIGQLSDNTYRHKSPFIANG